VNRVGEWNRSSEDTLQTGQRVNHGIERVEEQVDGGHIADLAGLESRNVGRLISR
jgi:hypothetical protein